MLSVGETATVLVAAVKGWGHKSAGILIVKMNKEMLAKSVELRNREKEKFLMFNTY